MFIAAVITSTVCMYVTLHHGEGESSATGIWWSDKKTDISFRRAASKVED